MHAYAWEVPIQPPRSPIKPVIHERLSSSSPTLNLTQKHQERVDFAEMRRKQNLEERRKRSREIVERAKTVAANHAKRVSEEVTRLREEIFRKQEEAESRRMKGKEKSATTIAGSSKVVPLVAVGDGIENQPPSKKANGEVKLLKASFRACQRLACVVAKRKLHNAHAKALSLKVRSARAVQRMWRKTHQLFESCKRLQAEHATLEFFLHGLSEEASFEEAVSFVSHPTCVKAAKASVSVCSFKDPDQSEQRSKVLLLCPMIIRHPSEVLSISLRKRNVLTFASRRLLHLLQQLVDNQTRLGLERFDFSFQSYFVLFQQLKQEDAEMLSDELFESLVEIRIFFEENQDPDSKRTFFQLLDQVKKLLKGNNDRYQAYIQRVAREVKRRREEKNLVRHLMMNPNYQPRPLTTAASAVVGVPDMSTKELESLLLACFREIKSRVMELTPNRKDLLDEWNEFMDVDLIAQQLNHGAFDFHVDFVRVIEFIVKHLIDLSEKPAGLDSWWKATEAKLKSTLAMTKTKNSLKVLISDIMDRLLKEISDIEINVKNFYLHMVGRKLQDDSTLGRKYVHLQNASKRESTRKWIATIRMNGGRPAEESLEPTRFDTRTYSDMLARVIIGECAFPSIEEQILDDFERKKLMEFHEKAKKLMEQTHIQVVLKQILVAFHPQFIGKLEQGGSSHDDPMERLREMIRPQILSEETKASFHRLMKQKTLQGILERRMSSILTKFCCEGEGSFPDSRMLRNLGMFGLEQDLREICGRFQRFVWLFMEARGEEEVMNE